ncbi:hypothetical protein V6N13_135939 [Hibiscus sabdariffa]
MVSSIGGVIVNDPPSSTTIVSSVMGDVLPKSLPRGLDLGYQGPDYTWSQGSTHSRLDRMLCNHLWDKSFPESSVSHLIRMRSDHRPILISVGILNGSVSPRQFLYFSGWLSHLDFQHMVLDN